MWISVADRLPEGRRLVDIWRKGHGRVANCTCYRLGATRTDGTPLAQWYQRYGGYAGGATVTHWREIPGPPGEE